jgi:hypothetical protein
VQAKFMPSRDDRSQATQPLPPGRIAPFPSGTGEMHGVVLKPKRGGKGIWIVTALLVLAAGGAGTLYFLHLPPFSPLPKPIEEAKPAPVEPAKPVEAKPEEPKPAEVEPAKPVEAKPEEAKPVEAKPAEAKPTPVEEPKKANVERAEKMVAKARQLLIEGHEHTALENLKKAEKLVPSGKLGAQIKLYQQQAMGKLGKAELVIEGKVPIIVDGHKFAAPRKVKVAAGPHTIEADGDVAEITLKRGEKKKLKARK